MKSTFEQLLQARARRGAGYLTLLDPDRLPLEELERRASICAEAGADGILVGTSLMLSTARNAELFRAPARPRADPRHLLSRRRGTGRAHGRRDPVPVHGERPQPRAAHRAAGPRRAPAEGVRHGGHLHRLHAGRVGHPDIDGVHELHAAHTARQGGYRHGPRPGGAVSRHEARLPRDRLRGPRLRTHAHGAGRVAVRRSAGDRGRRHPRSADGARQGRGRGRLRGDRHGRGRTTRAVCGS